MGWAGRMGRAGRRGTGVGGAEQRRVIRAQPIEVAVERRARGWCRCATALSIDGTGPPGFEPVQVKPFRQRRGSNSSNSAERSLEGHQFCLDELPDRVHVDPEVLVDHLVP